AGAPAGAAPYADADAILGHVDLRARPENHAAHRTLLGMGVRRDQRRLGLGRTLLATALDWAAAQPGLDWVDLEVLSANAPALRLYGDCGFTRTGEIADLFRVDGERLGSIFMARSAQAAPLARRTRLLNSD
ncbi:GNAT family N-acetyltransferase, partial [Rugamonas sp.]|uniref:GNAT family N-acetyltransferase n=1 Tax=Rugamonas sp. TaxID=1926287 RepID=UPI0025F1FDED